MNREIREKLKILLFVSVFITFFYGCFQYEKWREQVTVNKILDNPAYTVCKINRVQYSGHDNKYDHHTHVELGFAYEIDGVWYNAATRYNYVSGRNLEGVFLDKQIMVIYCRTNVEKRRILITREEYDKFGLPFPSGRGWVGNYIEGVGQIR